jgi:circadian clock protein KaiC
MIDRRKGIAGMRIRGAGRRPVPAAQATAAREHAAALPKAPTGIAGLDELTGGGLPRGRPTLVCGSAGSGKTLFAVHFLVHGATRFGEPGVFMSFEERAEEIVQNVASLGFDLPALVAGKRVALDHVSIERGEIEETGEYDLDGLFVRLAHAIDSVGARRVVLDTIEALFAGLSNATILRAELRRLFRWLKDRGLTAIVTGERAGRDTLTRQGLEEYVSDAVILLDHRVHDQVSTRRLRIVKYRGSSHGTNEYPFLIDERGISVLPVTSLRLAHRAVTDRIRTGVPQLDAMLTGKGYYRGSSVLVTGTAGSGKSSLAAHFADAACARGERCVYFLFEESPSQLVRNMRSIGIDLQRWVDKDLLHLHASRPSLSGLEQHLVRMFGAVRELDPAVVVVDPLSNLLVVGSRHEVRLALTRLVDFLKTEGITALYTSLIQQDARAAETDIGISSLMDTWIFLESIEVQGERNRGLHILKSRGMAHSNRIREFLITDEGVRLVDVYVGPDGVLTGSARLAQQAREAGKAREEKAEGECRRRAIEAQMASLQAELDSNEEDPGRVLAEHPPRRRRPSGVRPRIAPRRGVPSA